MIDMTLPSRTSPGDVDLNRLRSFDGGRLASLVRVVLSHPDLFSDDLLPDLESAVVIIEDDLLAEGSGMLAQAYADIDSLAIALDEYVQDSEWTAEEIIEMIRDTCSSAILRVIFHRTLSEFCEEPERDGLVRSGVRAFAPRLGELDRDEVFAEISRIGEMSQIDRLIDFGSRGSAPLSAVSFHSVIDAILEGAPTSWLMAHQV